MGWLDQRGSHVLARNECLQLLAVHAGGVGRIGLVDSGPAVIEPVIYRMLDLDVVVQVGPGSMLDAAEHQSIVSFEIDSVEPPEAWSVLIRGPARRVADDAITDHARPAGARSGGSCIPRAIRFCTSAQPLRDLGSMPMASRTPSPSSVAHVYRTMSSMSMDGSIPRRARSLL